MATFFIEQFGCRATQADAAAIERQLRDRGYGGCADADSADVVVVNTCTVTAAADLQARQSIHAIHRKNPAARIVVTGCYAQRALGEEKQCAFRRAQIGRTMHLLTLNGTGIDALGPWTRALSGNNLDVRISGEWQANQFLDAKISGVRDGHLAGIAV